MQRCVPLVYLDVIPPECVVECEQFIYLSYIYFIYIPNHTRYICLKRLVKRPLNQLIFSPGPYLTVLHVLICVRLLC